MTADKRLMVILLRILSCLQQNSQVSSGPLFPWSPVRLHRSPAHNAGAASVGAFKNSHRSQPLGIRVSRVGPRCVFKVNNTQHNKSNNLSDCVSSYNSLYFLRLALKNLYNQFVNHLVNFITPLFTLSSCL